MGQSQTSPVNNEDNADVPDATDATNNAIPKRDAELRLDPTHCLLVVAQGRSGWTQSPALRASALAHPGRMEQEPFLAHPAHPGEVAL